MSQTQVYSKSNKINSALDCCESRTVRTINTKHLQQQQQPHTVKVPSTSNAFVVNSGLTRLDSSIDFIIGNTCQKSATKAALTAEMQSAAVNCQTRSHRRMPMMKSSALLPIICIVILAQISTTSGRTLHGRKQILHSLENRLQHHKQVMQYERELSPIHGVQLHRRHHLNVRSTKMTTCSALDSMRKQANTSRRTLMDKIDEFTKVRFTQTAEEAFKAWSKHNLSLEHPYMHFYTLHNISKTEFPHLEGKQMSEELLVEEISNIIRTFKILQIVFKEIVNENNKQNWYNTYNYQYATLINFLEHTYDELTQNKNVAISALNESTYLRIINETITPNYNRTAQVREWLIIVESLSFFEYLINLCEKLMQMCN